MASASVTLGGAGRRLALLGAIGLAAFVALGAIGNMLPNSGTPAPISEPANVAPPAPPSLKAASASITAVRVSGQALFVDAQLEAPTPAGYLDKLVDVVEPLTAAFQAAHAEATGAVKDVVVTFTAPGHDRLGNPGTVQLMTVAFDAADLRAAHFDHLGPYGRLNLVTRVSVDDPDLVPEIAQWCAGGAGPFVRPFCAKARAAD